MPFPFTLFTGIETRVCRVSVMRQLLRLLGISLKQVRHLEHQIQSPLIADPHLLMGPQPVEYRHSGPQMRYAAKSGSSLTAVGVCYQKISTFRRERQQVGFEHQTNRLKSAVVARDGQQTAAQPEGMDQPPDCQFTDSEVSLRVEAFCLDDLARFCSKIAAAGLLVPILEKG